MSRFGDALEHQEAADLRAQVQRLAFEKRELQTELHATRTRMHQAEALRDALFGLTKPPLSAPKWASSPSASKPAEHIPVLLAGDFHWGEHIDAANMGGVNSYGIKTAETRYRRLIERTTDIAFSHLPHNRYPGIIYIRLGDMISGEIHPDMRETNELQAAPAIRSLVASEAHGLRELVRAFGHVHVVSVPGNHARLTPKPQSKRAAGSNLDTITAWWLEGELRSDKRITFHTSESGDVLLSLYGRRWLVTHGDKIGSKGGEGFIGAVATITRGMKRVHDQYAGYGTPLTGMFVGHFHVSLELAYGFSNGSLPGYSEYAKDGRLRPEAPMQWLLFFHPKYGVTSRWKVRLETEPTLKPEQALRPFEVA